MNRKRVYRLFREAGLLVRRRKRKRIDLVERKPLPKPAAANVSWSMDFMSDGLADGRRLRCLNIVDDCTRECLAIEVDTSITGSRVKAVLERLADTRGLPKSITVDHGPEFEGQVLDAWAYEHCVQLSFIRPGKPNENAYIESFNGKFRDECLNEHWFVTMAQARRVIEAWRVEYNTERTHSSLGDLTPEEFAEECLAREKDGVSSTETLSPGGTKRGVRSARLSANEPAFNARPSARALVPAPSRPGNGSTIVVAWDVGAGHVSPCGFPFGQHL